MGKLLEIEDLCVSFAMHAGAKKVLNGISLSVAAGETLAIVGESGSGKSVTVRTIMGLLGPTAQKTGKIYFYPQGTAEPAASEQNSQASNQTHQVQNQNQTQAQALELLSLPRQEAQKIRGNDISMIFQDPMTSLNPVMRIGEQIAEAMRIHQELGYKEAEQQTRELLELVRIPGGGEMIHRYPHELSGGMRQRVMISIAFACKPKLLIADEPTTALDVTIQAQILRLIAQLQQRNDMGVIFITHDMGVVAEVADKVCVMYQGELVEQGPVQQILREPQHPYTKALLDAVPKLGDMRGSNVPRMFPVLEMERALRGETVAEEEGRVVSYEEGQTEKILQVKNLEMSFAAKKNLIGKLTHEVRAVRDVSFDLYQGEILGIVGESGSGKSTVGNAVLGLLPEARGQIIYQSENILAMSEAERRSRRLHCDISFIFQDPLAALNPRMTIEAAIEEPMKIHGLYRKRGERKDKVKELLRSVNLSDDLGQHYPHEFSGGMLQRVNIARALASRPKIIIADESVSALDVSVQATVLNLLMHLQKDYALSFIFISHDMAVIERVCHRVYVMTEGHMVEYGMRREVFEDTRHSYTQKLLDAVPSFDQLGKGRYVGKQLEDGLAAAEQELANPVFAVGEKKASYALQEISKFHYVEIS